jgi:multisubunit Na+/H+ antiporter MnhG subunit
MYSPKAGLLQSSSEFVMEFRHTTVKEASCSGCYSLLHATYKTTKWHKQGIQLSAALRVVSLGLLGLLCKATWLVLPLLLLLPFTAQHLQAAAAGSTAATCRLQPAATCYAQRLIA